MVAWHLAAVLFLFRWIFRDPKVDVRFLAVGVLLPDLVDLSTVTLVGGESGELWGHSLIVPTVLGMGVLIGTRRGRRRRAWMALVVAWLFHLLIDRMWLTEAVFLWPLFGWDLLGEGSVSFWPAAWNRATADPWRWILEILGIGYLAWVAVASGLTSRSGRAELVQTGRLTDRPAGVEGGQSC